MKKVDSRSRIPFVLERRIRDRLQQRHYTLHVIGAGDRLCISASVRSYHVVQLIIAAAQEFLEQDCVHIEIQARLPGHEFHLSVGDAPDTESRCATVIDNGEIYQDPDEHERQATRVIENRLLTAGEHA